MNIKPIYLVDAGTALGDEAHNDWLFAAGHKAKAHCGMPFQGDAAWLGGRLIVAVEVWQLVRGRFVQVAAAESLEILLYNQQVSVGGHGYR